MTIIKVDDTELPAAKEWPPKGIHWYYSDDAVAIACGKVNETLKQRREN